jgi:hypothetical protein
MEKSMYKLPGKLIITCISSLLALNAFADDIPYCKGTSVMGSKHTALQTVVKSFAAENKCKIGKNCLLNFDTVKYSIAWSEPCVASEARLNDAKGSTFLCDQGKCVPYGFSNPSANY